MMRVWNRWIEENWQWGMQYDITTEWQTLYSYGSYWTSGVLLWFDTTLEHSYRCFIFYPHGSLTWIVDPCMPWAACKGSRCTGFPWRWTPDVFGNNGLTNTASGVLIINKSSSQMSRTTIWTIKIGVYSSDIFSRSILSNVILDEHLVLWSGELLNIIRDTTYSKFQGP